MSASVIPVMLLSYGDTIMNKLDTIHERSVHLDLGSSIQSNSDWYVKVPSQLCKWVNKVFTLNFMEW